MSEEGGTSKALLRDCRFKQYQKKTAYTQWQEEQEMKAHRMRIRKMKSAIDNSPPFYFSAAQNRNRQLIEEDRLHIIEDENLQLLGRLHAIANREPLGWHTRKPGALSRGDAYRLRKPSGKRVWRYDWQALKGSTMRKSLRVQEEVLRKLVSMKMVDPKEEKWLRKWLPKTKEGPVDVLPYNKAKRHSDEESPLSPVEGDPEELVKQTSKLTI